MKKKIIILTISNSSTIAVDDNTSKVSKRALIDFINKTFLISLIDVENTFYESKGTHLFCFD